MTSVRPQQVVEFEPDKTYPIVTRFGIKEMLGKDIKSYTSPLEMPLTVGEYSDIINEINELRKKLNALHY